MFLPLLSLVCVIMGPWRMGVGAQCPPVSGRCSCDSTIYEPVSISCKSAASLSEVMRSISGARGTRIDRLAIIDTQIPTLPARAFDGFQILALVLRQNGLSQVDTAAFNGGGGKTTLDTLNELSIQENRLGLIPQGGVAKLPNLRKLILKDNAITSVPPNAFSSYASRAQLEKLDLSGNQLTGLGTASLNGLTGLKEVSFEKNMIPRIPAKGLQVVRETLEDLNLGLNQLNQVNPDDLDFPNLKSLSLEFNNIQGIRPEAFRKVPNLLYLYVGGNKFPRFDPDMFRYIGQLEILGIGDGNIREIPSDAFKYTPRLRILEMSDAAVSNIQEGAFQRIRSTIQRIVMNKNQLTRIRADMFRGLSSLQSLDLEGNQLTSVENLAWANLPALRHLDISNNQLRVLEPQTFQGTFLPSTPDTRTLYICANPWVCDQRLEWFRNWLRNDLAIEIDKRPACLSACAEPDYFNNILLRDPDPITSLPFTNAPITLPVRQGAVMSSIGWIILAIILAILLTSILLLAMVRYFVGRRRRQEKERDEEERILRSSAVSGGYHAPGSVVGSAYPGSAVDLDLPPATTLDVPERSYWPY